MKLILQYLRRHLGIFLLSTLFLTMEAMADLLQPTYMSFIVDDGVANADIGRILGYGGVMLAIALVGAFSAVMRNHFASRTSQTIGKELRQDMYANVQGLSLENIDHLQPASIITRITNDVTQVQDFINGIMRIMVKAPITCVGAIALIIIQTPRQAPVMTAIILASGLLIYGNVRVGYPRFGWVQKKLDGLNGASREFLSSVRVVKAFRAEDAERAKFRDTSLALARANTDALRTMAVFGPLINLTVNLGIVALLWISRDQKSGEIGRLMASVNYMTQVLFSVTMISNVINIAVRAMASSRRIGEVLDERPAQAVPEHPLTPDIRGEVAFRNVTFTYAGTGKAALEDVSFHALPGQTVGIIGPTGSGKSTLVSLVPRFYDATAGNILVDGCDVRDIDGRHLRGAVGFVPQRPQLFSGSISKNLRWGRPDATDDELRQAARIACADGFIEGMENGYDTWLEQGGVNLSGGQKQRLALARALVTRPRILILDDCTSALDAATEAAVLDGLRTMAGSCTTLLISQRVSTVMRADRILCLDGGRVQGFGTHAELMAGCAAYRAIYDSQIGGERHVG